MYGKSVAFDLQLFITITFQIPYVDDSNIYHIARCKPSISTTLCEKKMRH